jgi:ATP-dependent Clp protease ATP-binding subunit ClpC
MFERFTAVARRVVVLSQEEARELHHNYIGTEHILLGLLGERDSTAFRVLEKFGLTLENARADVRQIIGEGKQDPKSGHIPFTPRAKKVLELSLREALTLHHNYIGTEHILLGLIRERDGVGPQVIKSHADLLAVQAAVLDEVPPGTGAETERGPLRRWVRARRLRSGELGGTGEASGSGLPGGPGGPGALAEESGLSATPAADATLAAASNLAGERPVGSHHLLLAALSDTTSAAAKALTALGVDLTQAKDALYNVDIEGTSDELPEEAGRRQLSIQVTKETVTLIATDPALVRRANAALLVFGGEDSGEGSGTGGDTGGEGSGEGGTPGGVIRGADLSGAAANRLAATWKALHEALETIARTAAQPGGTSGGVTGGATGGAPAAGQEARPASEPDAGDGGDPAGS